MHSNNFPGRQENNIPLIANSVPVLPGSNSIQPVSVTLNVDDSSWGSENRILVESDREQTRSRSRTREGNRTGQNRTDHVDGTVNNRPPFIKQNSAFAALYPSKALQNSNANVSESINRLQNCSENNTVQHLSSNTVHSSGKSKEKVTFRDVESLYAEQLRIASRENSRLRDAESRRARSCGRSAITVRHSWNATDDIKVSEKSIMYICISLFLSLHNNGNSNNVLKTFMCIRS